MKFFSIIVASLAAVAAASPRSPPKRCTPGTYSCTTNPDTGGPGWRVCNTSRKWVFAGDCPPDTVCKFYPPSKSPYCVPPDFEFP
ncbi:hypothetical protein ACRE_030120 [Hapsidospora chrysogenum ATCC 11550]|uniref:Uncharacterized protein n=1 Tax=Hapsidospora chrysogenum (strain ATCC 11550 / CBS 779.69 / DSM 880 / IAM 14645 / JCM 23072 / IMI 49137) TaxID=857340 RepID=A0A086T9X5_HAPC1|nr:hypothetical protein ACRE_030120 [Hapsidospora chrysogenum ATCC 11550]